MPIWGGSPVGPFVGILVPNEGRTDEGALFTPGGVSTTNFNLPSEGPTQSFAVTSFVSSSTFSGGGIWAFQLVAGQTGNVLQLDIPAEIQVNSGTPSYADKTLSLAVSYADYTGLVSGLCAPISPDPATFDVAVGLFTPTLYTATFDISAVPADATIYLQIAMFLNENSGAGEFFGTVWGGRASVIS